MKYDKEGGWERDRGSLAKINNPWNGSRTFPFIQQYLLHAYCYDQKCGPQNSCSEAIPSTSRMWLLRNRPLKWKFRYMRSYGWASLVAQLLKNSSTNAGESRVVGLSPGSGRSPKRKWYIAPIFFPGKSMERWAMGSQSQTWLSAYAHTCGWALLQRFRQTCGTLLVVQWSRIHLPVQGTGVRSLGWEDSTCHGATKTMCPK